MAPQDCITIPLTRGYSTVIDAIDSDLADFKWFAQTSHDDCIYAARMERIGNRQKTVPMHRIILGRILGRELSRPERVDHIDLDGLNNRRDNLRIATQAQNSRNRKKNKDNTTGYKGVSKNGKGFLAYINANGKRLYLGTHATPEIAAIAYNEAAVKYHGEFASLNQINKFSED